MENVSLVNTVIQHGGMQVLISGSLEIRDAAELKNELLQFLANHDRVELHFKNIDKIDLSALQLLIALSRAASDQGKDVQYVFEPTAYVKDVLDKSGFNKFITI